MSYILLTRSIEENELAAKKLQNLGLMSISLPMISYIDEEISDNDLESYKHIIITSKHAAKIASSLYNKKVECWVVGKESASILKNNANITVTGIAKNIEELLSIIAMVPEEEAKSFFESSIYLSGDIITKNLPDFIKRLVIYRVVYTDLISRHQIEMISNKKIKYILVYSKNCAINLVRLIEKYNLFSYVKDSTIIAISEEVANVFCASNIKTLHSLESTFEDMLKLLIEYEQQESY